VTAAEENELEQFQDLPAFDSKGTPRGKAGYIFPDGNLHAATVVRGDYVTVDGQKHHTRTDAGNALRLVQWHGHDLRFVPQWKDWIVWDGARWRRDSLGRVMELAKGTARRIYDEARDEDDDAERQALSKWAAQSESQRALKAMVELAKTDPKVAIDAKELDVSPWLLPCPNGTLDLRTGGLRGARRGDLLTHLSGAEYHEGAELSETSAGFISWVTKGRPELEAFIQRAMGYTLTGDTSERMLFLLLGPDGHNGKSTLLTQARVVLGDFAKRTAMATLEKQKWSRRGGATEDVARLKGARLVSAVESEEGMELSAATIKELVGNEAIIARELYKGSTEFDPQFKLWLATNHEPHVSAGDQAVWDRLRLVPFDNRVAEGEANKALRDELAQDAPAWLAWMVQGCLQWQRSGLGVPLEVREATEEYRGRMDRVAEFFDWVDEVESEWVVRCHEAKDRGLDEPDRPRELNFAITALHATYQSWAKGNDAPLYTRPEFRRLLEARGWRQKTVKGTPRMRPPKQKPYSFE